MGERVGVEDDELSSACGGEGLESSNLDGVEWKWCRRGETMVGVGLSFWDAPNRDRAAVFLDDQR